MFKGSVQEARLLGTPSWVTLLLQPAGCAEGDEVASRIDRNSLGGQGHVNLMDDGLPLQTERLTLRRVLPDDEHALFAIYGNDENARFEFGPAWTFDQVVALIPSQGSIRLGDPGVPFYLVAIENQASTLIGSIDLTINNVSEKQGEIGFSFNLDFGGRGLATEAVNAALGYAYSKMDLHRIFAAVDTRNTRSWRLLERVGMRREAHFVHANLQDGEWTDDYTYAMLDNEWHAKNAT